MFENVKLLLGLQDGSQDQLIQLYIEKITNSILAYCNIDALNMALESFVEDKVVSIMKSKTDNAQAVKAVTRGDTRIEYNVSSVASGTLELTDSDRAFLSRYRKVVMF